MKLNKQHKNPLRESEKIPPFDHGSMLIIMGVFFQNFAKYRKHHQLKLRLLKIHPASAQKSH